LRFFVSDPKIIAEGRKKMPENGAAHARAFIDRTQQLRDVGSVGTRNLLLEAAQTIAVPAVMEAGPARNLIVGASQWASRPFDEASLNAFRANPYHPATRIPDVDEMNSLALSSGTIRAVRELGNPEVGSRVREILRSPAGHERRLLSELEDLEPDFKGALLVETARTANRDDRFKGQIERTLEDLQALRDPLRRIATSGEGREGSWFIGVVAACSLAAWWCAAAAVVAVVVVAVVIVANK
jgi:hypothetical protein